MQFEVWSKVLKVVVVWQFCGPNDKMNHLGVHAGSNPAKGTFFFHTVWDGGVESHGRLVCPAASHVADGVSSSAQHQQRQVEALHVLHTLGVTCARRTC